MPFKTYDLNDGNKIPAVAYGTGSKWKWTDVTPFVEQALEAGFDHLDTAAFYGTEDCVAAGIKESGLSRADLYITTKFGGRGSNVTEEIQISLANLAVKQVDLYLIHFPSAFGNDLEGTWKKMEQVKLDGYTKSIGVSNFYVDLLEKLVKSATIMPAVNQIRLHPYNYDQMKPTLEFCKSHNIVVEAFSSLAPITSMPGGPVDAVLKVIAAKHNATPAQIIQLWVLSKDIVVVTTSSKKERLQEYLAVADLDPLTQEEIVAIEEAGAKGPPAATTAGLIAKRFRETHNKTSLRVLAVLLLAGIFLWTRSRMNCQIA